jgi:hypothetical protein
MRIASIIRHRLRALFFRRSLERELEEEIRYHLDRQMEEDIANGLRPEEARRVAERAAMGVERKRLLWMILHEVFVMCAVGLAIGLPVAPATTKFVKSFLFDIQPNDPLAIAGAAVVLVLAAIAAGYGPAWRASRIDPWNALRHE